MCVPAEMTPFSPTSFFAISPMVLSFAPCGLSAESLLPESSIGDAAHTTILLMYYSGHIYQLTPKELARQGEDGCAPDLDQHAGGRPRGVDHHDARVLALSL